MQGKQLDDDCTNDLAHQKVRREAWVFLEHKETKKEYRIKYNQAGTRNFCRETFNEKTNNIGQCLTLSERLNSSKLTTGEEITQRWNF